MEKRTARAKYKQVGVVLFSIAITVAIALMSKRISRFAYYGYFGIFLISLLSNATIVFPVPGLAVTFAMGGVLQPILVGLVAGIGEALGELTGYLAGYGGRGIVENGPSYQRVEEWTKRFGLLVIFVLSVVPNPIFDLAGIAAGAFRFPPWRFLLSCWLGKTIKTVLIALMGARLIPMLKPLL